MNSLYKIVMDTLVEKAGSKLNSTIEVTQEMAEKIYVIPPARTRYLSEIAENNRSYDAKVSNEAKIAQKLYGIF